MYNAQPFVPFLFYLWRQIEKKTLFFTVARCRGYMFRVVVMMTQEISRENFNGL